MDPLDIATATTRIPEGTVSISIVPGFGGSFIIRFTGSGGGFLGPAITAPAGMTFQPDGTITYPQPYASTAA